jgi:hypothetical protein
MGLKQGTELTCTACNRGFGLALLENSRKEFNCPYDKTRLTVKRVPRKKK